VSADKPSGAPVPLLLLLLLLLAAAADNDGTALAGLLQSALLLAGRALCAVAPLPMSWNDMS
jgi:uncharacterized membrane protein